MDNTNGNNWVKFNVGGKIFLTTRQTINAEPRSLLAGIINDQNSEKDENGAYLLDRDPGVFKIIMTYLRTKHVIPSKKIKIEMLIDEAMHLNLNNLLTQLNGLRKGKNYEGVSRIYRILSMPLEDLVVTLGEMLEGWKFEQITKVDSTSSHAEYLCVISKKMHGGGSSVEIPPKFASKKKK